MLKGKMKREMRKKEKKIGRGEKKKWNAECAIDFKHFVMGFHFLHFRYSFAISLIPILVHLSLTNQALQTDFPWQN